MSGRRRGRGYVTPSGGEDFWALVSGEFCNFAVKMKIIGLWDNYGEGIPPEGPAACFWATDCCLLRESRPLYAPDFDAEFGLYPSLALHIDRLGKGFAARFAHRYWREASLWLSVRAEGLLKRCQSAGAPLGAALCFDCSIVASPFFPLAEADVAAAHFTVEASDGQLAEWSGAELRLGAAAAVEAVARYNTLKTGDVILLGFPKEGIRLVPGLEITIKGAGGTLLNRFNVR